MSAHPGAAAIIAAEVLTETFATNPAEIVARYTGKAADCVHGMGPREDARLYTHVAAGVHAAADNPAVIRGTVLEALIERFGSGLEA